MHVPLATRNSSDANRDASFSATSSATNQVVLVPPADAPTYVGKQQCRSDRVHNSRTATGGHLLRTRRQRSDMVLMNSKSSNTNVEADSNSRRVSPPRLSFGNHSQPLPSGRPSLM
ncbi:hypothetical protein IOCL2690_000346900 [Leishmania lindenbergi]|uniref:Uncharacterized protein n=1 Tax=Leishmania lindenbergi TaxID=651832 RepID=A0AAW3AJB4_9TRYP